MGAPFNFVPFHLMCRPSSSDLQPYVCKTAAVPLCYTATSQARMMEKNEGQRVFSWLGSVFYSRKDFFSLTGQIKEVGNLEILAFQPL